MVTDLTPALEALRRGEFVVVLDDASRENEADLIVPAAATTTEKMAFLLRHTSGIVCVPMTAERADALQLWPMVSDNTDKHRTAFTVSVDAAAHTSTGISAADRAVTARLLADPAARPEDFTRPGHMFPLRTHHDGVLGRRGHTEAAVDLVRLAGVPDVAVISELVREDGTVYRAGDALAFAARHGLVVLEVSDVVAARTHAQIERVATIPLATQHGEFAATLFRTRPDGLEHIVLVVGDVTGREPVLTRIHSECATGDLFGSLRCDCGEQLDAALKAVIEAGRGVVLYERGHEGRGIGLAEKFKAYELQDHGVDTVDANLLLGHPSDARDFAPAAAVVRHLGINTVRLLTNNPDKVDALRHAGLAVEAQPLRTRPVVQNIRYLRTKQERLRHDLDLNYEGVLELVVGGQA